MCGSSFYLGGDTLEDFFWIVVIANIGDEITLLCLMLALQEICYLMTLDICHWMVTYFHLWHFSDKTFGHQTNNCYFFLWNIHKQLWQKNKRSKILGSIMVTLNPARPCLIPRIKTDVAKLWSNEIVVTRINVVQFSRLYGSSTMSLFNTFLYQFWAATWIKPRNSAFSIFGLWTFCNQFFWAMAFSPSFSF